MATAFYRSGPVKYFQNSQTVQLLKNIKSIFRIYTFPKKINEKSNALQLDHDNSATLLTVQTVQVLFIRHENFIEAWRFKNHLHSLGYQNRYRLILVYLCLGN